MNLTHHSLLIAVLSLTIAGCSTLPDAIGLGDKVSISKPKPFKPSVHVSAGKGKYQDTHNVFSASVEARQPLFDIILHISGDPAKDAQNPPLILEAVANGTFNISSSVDSGVNFKAGFAGIGVRSNKGRAAALFNANDYVLTAESYHQITNVLRLRNTITHQKSYSGSVAGGGSESTRLGTSLDYRINCNWSAGGTFETGKNGSDSDERLMLNVSFDNDC